MKMQVKETKTQNAESQQQVDLEDDELEEYLDGFESRDSLQNVLQSLTNKTGLT